MSSVDAGERDWQDYSGQLFDRTFTPATVESVLRDDYDKVLDSIGVPFEVERTANGLLFIVIDGQRRYAVELGRRGRIILTSILPANGPL